MTDNPRKNLNYLPLHKGVFGYDRRREIAEMPMERSAFLPKAVSYSDIDSALRDFVESIDIVCETGELYPTFVLYSNQKFSEYAQTWKHTDKNNNLLLNFKAVTRESNPQYGTIHKKMWNIPGDRFYLVKKGRVLDDNGSESIMAVMSRQPLTVDLNYKVSVFTDKYQSLNEFNVKINKLFSSCQCYVSPNGYYMPMKLTSIGDESEYSIDDRQFYSQTYSITVMGFVLTDEDFRVEEWPLKMGVSCIGMKMIKKRADVEIEECVNEDGGEEVMLTLTFPKCVNDTEFVMDSNMKVTSYEMDNLVATMKVYVNDVEYSYSDKPLIKEDDVVKVFVRHRNPMKDGVLKLIGVDPYVKK